ncbi:MAG: iron-containing alcohol dehydrogenase [Arcobacter sp.]|jgi:NADP-dependent alcohol dehydrogenase|uniref:iron-containing alcohol dehydrogenase n=1 Tax=unclassified Arcobacter TaxID=2593671 RepID=UPI000229653F|nr:MULTISPECIES: iron-containing alcohol dehydrogenase [unclassified Arcobacter]MDY3200626.1 iron-containing alcohol dehydrogenase [Arcobacter sp.]BAK72096.1 alcohol dehydrogenase [Arcobacter sp. L]
MTYTYFNPTVIEFGEGKIKSITKYIDKDLKVLVVYGGGSIKKNGVFEQVSKALEGYTWFEFGGVEPNPSVETLNKAVALIKEKNIDFVLAVGGGSVIDGSKYLVSSALYDGDGWDFLEGKDVKNALPLGAVLTIPATGSESNGTAVISKKSTNEKRYFASSLTYPKFAILDPSIMSSLDDRQLANGLVDAFVHTCEQYLTYPNSSLLHDGYAQTILRGLYTLSLNWQNRRTILWQENLMLLANQALNGFIGSGVPQDWATHMIGHEITAFYGLDHARSLAVVQPHLLRVMIEDKKEKLTQMGKEVFDMPHNYEMVVEAIEYMYHSIGVSTKLKDYDIDNKVIENITGALRKHGMNAIGEKGNLTLDKVAVILENSIK